MALANALRVLSSHSSACSSSSSSLSSRKKKASIATKHSSSRLGRSVIASCSSSSSSSSSSPESTNRSPRRRKKGREPLRAILEPCVLEPRSMDEDDDNGETEKITKKTIKRTMTSKDREDDNRSAATIVETDFLVRFIVSGVFTASFRREVYDDEKKKNFKQRTTKHRPFFFTCRRRGVNAYLSSRSKSSSSLRYRLTKAFFPL